ncbi:MAG: nitroreductase [Halieaceae bacterium]|mgnify:CR=1 FL=1|jgi:nitroreductase|nr:nitroreductase [Halieaceae bacterium]
MNENFQVFEQVVSSRRSLRAFLPRAVSQELLESLFNVAARAPSNCNTQPWIVHLVSGAKLEALRKQMPDEFMEGKISMDFPYAGTYEGVYKDRQHSAAKALYDALDIHREDKTRRQEAFMRNFTFFDAPHLAFFFLPEPFGLREACDLGMFAQTLMLALTANGLGSCPQTALSLQVDLVREQLGVDASNRLIFGLSFGYPDPDAAVNSVTTERAAVTDFVTFHR